MRRRHPFLGSLLVVFLIFVLANTLSARNATPAAPLSQTSEALKAQAEATRAHAAAEQASSDLAEVQASTPKPAPSPLTTNSADKAMEQIIVAASPDEIRQWPTPSGSSGYEQLSAESLYLYSPQQFPLRSTPGALAWVEYAGPTQYQPGGYKVYVTAKNNDWCEATFQPTVSANVTANCTISGTTRPFYP